jgi:hypothetical protein
MAAKRSIAGPTGRSKQGAAQQRHQSRSSNTVRPPSRRQSDQTVSRASSPDVEEKADATSKTVALTADALEEIIEHERVQLMQVHAMLKCLYEVLLYADDDDSTMHADVANVSALLIDDCVVRLETIVRALQGWRVGMIDLVLGRSTRAASFSEPGEN